MIKAKWQELHEYDCFLGTVVSSFMQEQDINTIPTGRYDLEDGCYVNVDEYDTRENYNFEVHQKYIDVHLMVDGEEEIFFAPLSHGSESIAYDEEKDVAFYKCDNDSYCKIRLVSGEVVVLFPEEIHAPCNFERKRHNRKLVFKVPVDCREG